MLDGIGTPPDKNPPPEESTDNSSPNTSPWAKALKSFNNEKNPTDFSRLPQQTTHGTLSYDTSKLKVEHKSFLLPPRAAHNSGLSILPTSPELESVIARNLEEGILPQPFTPEEQTVIQATLAETFTKTTMLIVPEVEGLAENLLMGFYHLPIGTRKSIEEDFMKQEYVTPDQRGQEYWTYLLSSLVYPSENQPDYINRIQRSANIHPIVELVKSLPFLTDKSIIFPLVNQALDKAERIEVQPS